uniref:Fibrinogen C-terminal domain-containing protein n=1 Tax=Magallana gigas TaxID=29159 RepID=A0A8W8J3G1_MAGGI
MNILLFCELVVLFSCCTGNQKNPNIQELLEKILKIKQTSWRHDNSFIKSAKIGVLSTNVLNGSMYKREHTDCSDILQNDPSRKKHDGVYTIYPDQINKKEVIQKRVDGSTDFYRTWKEYKEGFGTPSRNYWIGNEVIHHLTNTSHQKIRIVLQRYSGEKGRAEYSKFAVGDEKSKYKLTVSGYSGTIGDSLGSHNGLKFTTKDQDNDNNKDNCAKLHYGGWWYGACFATNLNGLYASSAFKDARYNSWDLLEKFLKIKQTLWRHDNSFIKSAKIGVFSTYVLDGSKNSNDVIHQLTKTSPQRIRIVLQRYSGEKGRAEYSKFAVGDENSKYKLTVSGYRGTIGWPLGGTEFSGRINVLFGKLIKYGSALGKSTLLKEWIAVSVHGKRNIN